jgi:hypothetical protein
MKSDKEREEICKTRKDAGLNCNGCQYKEKCQGEKVDFILPEDIKPGTKQAKIYWELKSGKTAAEIIKTKEFASESVYIVARKHFPNAISKPGNAKARVKKAADKVIDKENYFGKSEIPEKAMEMAKAHLEKTETEKEIKAKEETMEFIEHYFDKKEPDPAPKIDERILNLEKMIRDGEKLQEKCQTITVILKDTKAALEEGKIIETYNKLQKMIEYMEVEK